MTSRQLLTRMQKRILWMSYPIPIILLVGIMMQSTLSYVLLVGYMTSLVIAASLLKVRCVRCQARLDNALAPKRGSWKDAYAHVQRCPSCGWSLDEPADAREGESKEAI